MTHYSSHSRLADHWQGQASEGLRGNASSETATLDVRADGSYSQDSGIIFIWSLGRPENISGWPEVYKNER